MIHLRRTCKERVTSAKPLPVIQRLFFGLIVMDEEVGVNNEGNNSWRKT